MNNNILSIVKEVNDENYMVCSQSIKWNIDAFTREKIDAYIVQELEIVVEIDGKIVNQDLEITEKYFEAWSIINGSINRNKNLKFDDEFRIGKEYDTEEQLKYSIGHKGKVSYIPKVYFIEKQNKLYEVISDWHEGHIKEALDLKSKEFSIELSNEFSKEKRFERESFVHKWEFDNSKVIYETVIRIAKNKFHNNCETDCKNFDNWINYIFIDEKYKDVKDFIIMEWSKISN